MLAKSKSGAVMRALAFHLCGPGSNPGADAIYGRVCCWFSLLLNRRSGVIYLFIFASLAREGKKITPDTFIKQAINRPLIYII